MDKLFDIDDIDVPKIKQSDFNTLAVKIFNNIASSYSESFVSKQLKDGEFPDENVCDKCTGCGTFILGDENKECFQDKEGGACYYRLQDFNGFALEVEAQMEDIWKIISSEITE